jgi:hypothetical protein
MVLSGAMMLACRIFLKGVGRQLEKLYFKIIPYLLK